MMTKHRIACALLVVVAVTTAHAATKPALHEVPGPGGITLATDVWLPSETPAPVILAMFWTPPTIR